MWRITCLSPDNAQTVAKPAHDSDPTKPPPAEEVAPLVYDELRRDRQGLHAAGAAGPDHPGDGARPRGLLRLAGAGTPWHDKRHFVGIAARSMRQILVERARARAGAEALGRPRPRVADRLDCDAARQIGACCRRSTMR
jgi:hypothetical protein